MPCFSGTIKNYISVSGAVSVICPIDIATIVYLLYDSGDEILMDDAQKLEY